MKTLLAVCLLLIANAAWGQCPFGATPVYVTPPDANGETHVQAGWDITIADPVNGPSPVGGTLVLCRRVFFNDDPLATTQAGKNAAFSINHLTGSGTVQTNQDRALWVSTGNPAGDTSTHYSMTSLQAETDLAGSPTFKGSGPDTEVAGASVQLSDTHAGKLPSTSMGQNAIRAQVFHRGGAWTSCPNGACLTAVRGITASIYASEPGNGTILAGGMFEAYTYSRTGPPYYTGIGMFLPSAMAIANGLRFANNEGLRVGDFGNKPGDWNIRSLGTPTSGMNYFGGPVVANSSLVTNQPANTDLAGTGVLPFSYTFAGHYQQPPICVVSDTTTGAAALIQVTKVGFTVQGVTGNAFNYICIGRQIQ